MSKLTTRTLATGVTINDLIHIVNTGDISQDPSGSSYKANIGQVADAIGGYQYYTAVTVSSAEILTLSSSPIELLPNPGIGNYYDAKFIIEYTFNTTPYVTVRPLAITDGTNISYECFILSSYGSDTIFIYQSMVGTLGNGFFSNNPLYITNQLVDPTSGDGELLIKIWYSIRSLG
jgi:hypothetical protein